MKNKQIIQNIAIILAWLIIIMPVQYASAISISFNPNAVKVTHNTAYIPWSTSANSTGEVKYGTTQTSLTHKSKNSTEGTQFYVSLTGLTPSQLYFFEINAKNSTKTLRSPTSNSTFYQFTTSAAPDTTPPKAVNSLTSTPGKTSISLTWSINTTIDKDVAKYEVYQDDILLTSSLTSKSHTAYNLKSSTEYKYKVSAIDLSGNKGPNTSITVKTLSATAKTVTVTGISAEVKGTTVIIKWSSSDPSHSRINYGTTNLLDQKKEDATLTTTHNITLSGLTANTNYSYSVVSCDTYGNCGNSSTYSFTTTKKVDLFLSVDQFDCKTETKQYHNSNEIKVSGKSAMYSDVYVYVNDKLQRYKKIDSNQIFSFSGIDLDRNKDPNIIKITSSDGKTTKTCSEKIELDYYSPVVDFDSFSNITIASSMTIKGNVSDNTKVTAYFYVKSASDKTPPPQVTGLTNKTVDKNTLTITWNAIKKVSSSASTFSSNSSNSSKTTETIVSDFDSYLIYRNDVTSGPIGQASTNTFTDSKVSSGQTYTYYVSAIDTSGNEGTKSTSLKLTTIENGTTKPAISHITIKNPALKLTKSYSTTANTSTAFTETITLNTGKNILKIIFKDAAGNEYKKEIPVEYDSSPPKLLHPTADEIKKNYNPSYMSSVTLNGQVDDLGSEIWVWIGNTASTEPTKKILASELGANGTFSVPVTLISTAASLVAGAVTVAGSASSNGSTGSITAGVGQGTKIKMIAVDKAGRKSSAIEESINYVPCGSGNYFQIKITPSGSIINSREILEGLGAYGFSYELKWQGQGPAAQAKVTSITVTQAPLSSTDKEKYDWDWIGAPVVTYNKANATKGFVLINFLPRTPTGTTYMEKEKNISDHRINECWPGLGCVKLLLMMELRFNNDYLKQIYGSGYSTTAQPQEQKQCVELKIQLDQRVDPSAIPKELLEAAIDVINETIAFLDIIYDPIKIITQITLALCLVAFLSKFLVDIYSKWQCKYSNIMSRLDSIGGAIKGITDTVKSGGIEKIAKWGGDKGCDAEFPTDGGGDDAEANKVANAGCKQCASALKTAKTVTDKWHLFCDRVVCPSVPSLQYYIKTNYKGGKQSSWRDLGQSAATTAASAASGSGSSDSSSSDSSTDDATKAAADAGASAAAGATGSGLGAAGTGTTTGGNTDYPNKASTEGTVEESTTKVYMYCQDKTKGTKCAWFDASNNLKSNFIVKSTADNKYSCIGTGGLKVGTGKSTVADAKKECTSNSITITGSSILNTIINNQFIANNNDNSPNLITGMLSSAYMDDSVLYDTTDEKDAADAELDKELDEIDKELDSESGKNPSGKLQNAQYNKFISYADFKQKKGGTKSSWKMIDDQFKLSSKPSDCQFASLSRGDIQKMFQVYNAAEKNGEGKGNVDGTGKGGSKTSYITKEEAKKIKEGCNDFHPPQAACCPWEYMSEWQWGMMWNNEVKQSYCLSNADDEENCGTLSRTVNTMTSLCSPPSKESRKTDYKILSNYRYADGKNPCGEDKYDNEIMYYVQFDESGSFNSVIRGCNKKATRKVETTDNYIGITPGINFDPVSVDLKDAFPQFDNSELSSKEVKSAEDKLKTLLSSKFATDLRKLSTEGIIKKKTSNNKADKLSESQGGDIREIYLEVAGLLGDPGRQYLAQPEGSFMQSLITLCLSGILSWIEQFRNMLMLLMQCFQTILVTGDGSAGQCQTIISQYICDLIWEAISCLMNRMGGGAGQQRVGMGGIGNFFGAVSEASTDIMSSAQSRYGEDNLFSSTFAAKNLVHDTCVYMFTGEWPTDWLSKFDMATTKPINSTVLLFPATRRWQAYDATTGYARYVYRIGYSVFAGADIHFDLKLKCSSGATLSCTDEKGSPAICDCGHTGDYSSKTKEMLITRHQSGNCPESGDLSKGGYCSDEVLFVSQTPLPLRFDTAAIEYKPQQSTTAGTGTSMSNPAALTGGATEKIKEIGHPPVGLCQFWLSSLEFKCGVTVPQSGYAQFLGEPTLIKTTSPFELGDKNIARVKIANTLPKDAKSCSLDCAHTRYLIINWIKNDYGAKIYPSSTSFVGERLNENKLYDLNLFDVSHFPQHAAATGFGPFSIDSKYFSSTAQTTSCSLAGTGLPITNPDCSSATTKSHIRIRDSKNFAAKSNPTSTDKTTRKAAGLEFQTGTIGNNYVFQPSGSTYSKCTGPTEVGTEFEYNCNGIKVRLSQDYVYKKLRATTKTIEVRFASTTPTTNAASGCDSNVHNWSMQIEIRDSVNSGGGYSMGQSASISPDGKVQRKTISFPVVCRLTNSQKQQKSIADLTSYSTTLTPDHTSSKQSYGMWTSNVAPSESIKVGDFKWTDSSNPTAGFNVKMDPDTQYGQLYIDFSPVGTIKPNNNFNIYKLDSKTKAKTLLKDCKVGKGSTCVVKLAKAGTNITAIELQKGSHDLLFVGFDSTAASTAQTTPTAQTIANVGAGPVTITTTADKTKYGIAFT